MTLIALQNALREAAQPDGSSSAARFIKTGPGEYGEGDQFLGVSVPEIRKLVSVAETLTDKDRTLLIRSRWHEERLLGFLIMVRQFEQGDLGTREKIFHSSLRETRHLNGWDLVDASAPNIVGAWVLQSPEDETSLTRLAKSPSLWERRIAIVATLTLIRAQYFEPTMAISHILLQDSEDLIHKAVGWMLREMGKRDPDQLRKFLQLHAAGMPRTMLRYAIEKFAPEERRRWREVKFLPQAESESASHHP